MDHTPCDFDYDGLADILDTAAFISTNLYDTGPYRPAMSLGVVAVPEPAAVAAVGCLAFAVCAAVRRRR